MDLFVFTVLFLSSLVWGASMTWISMLLPFSSAAASQLDSPTTTIPSQPAQDMDCGLLTSLAPIGLIDIDPSSASDLLSLSGHRSSLLLFSSSVRPPLQLQLTPGLPSSHALAIICKEGATDMSRRSEQALDSVREIEFNP